LTGSIRVPIIWLVLSREKVGVDKARIGTSGTEAGVENREVFLRWEERMGVQYVY
jgi:hypothetical protein